jgi:hypothetical protein
MSASEDETDVDAEGDEFHCAGETSGLEEEARVVAIVVVEEGWDMIVQGEGISVAALNIHPGEHCVPPSSWLY